MYRFCLLILLCLCAAFTKCDNDNNKQKLPLCGTCTCVFDNDQLPAKVNCKDDVTRLLQAESTWINPLNNQSYEYSELTLTNQEIMFLNFTFPTSKLTYLSITNSEVYRIVNSPFKNLENMVTLILSNNGLDLLMPDSFKGLYMEERYMPLRSLKELRLDHNNLHTLNMNLFEHTTDLEILDLSYNPLKVIDKHTTIAIDSLPFLKELYLGYTQIKTLPDQIMHTPIQLSILDLSGNPIEEIPETLGESHNLTTLYLNDTGFINITKNSGFPEMPSLKNLYLCNLRNLERIESESLSGLSGLQELHICNNIKLTHIDDFAIAKINEHGGATWPMIKKLNLFDNKLGYIDSDFLSRWDLLTYLNINDNPWTCECENQWLIEDLMPTYKKINPENANSVKCGAPIEMNGEHFIDLYERQYKMRCLDIYGAKPEQDAFMLVGVLIGVLIALPAILFIIFAYQRRWFGLFNMCDNSPAAYTRRFYSSTPRDEDF
ncbi:toll-like receptor 3 [Sitophilus oryzae]|uniref:Toll-like receptor 3 n=1 Tax=Sitophilus oryzae TaxID=7048 RepID=A0A6J2YJU2_SITOR|nr:toll-like receptor 3 [Sitophilus oryzae]